LCHLENFLSTWNAGRKYTFWRRNCEGAYEREKKRFPLDYSVAYFHFYLSQGDLVVFSSMYYNIMHVKFQGQLDHLNAGIQISLYSLAHENCVVKFPKITYACVQEPRNIKCK
jgi:hypothetical protein